MIRLEDILSQDNMLSALRRVEENNGAPGIDGLGAKELRAWIHRHPGQITSSIMNGTFVPRPVKRVYIPKDDGVSMRPLGLPCSLDKLVQQAVAQKLTSLYDPTFSESSYGFRPGRGAHDAVKAVCAYLNEGYEYAIDLDLKSFFDTVPRGKLMKILSRRISDGRIISLVHKMLNVDIVEKGKRIPTVKGVVQGGPASPILSNIMLDELDKELEKRGHKFARYADDVLILFRSRKAAERTYESLTRFIEDKLDLVVNRDKTKVGRVNPGMKFLGFAFYKTRKKGSLDSHWHVTVHRKPIRRFRDRVKKLLPRKAPDGIEATKKRFTLYLLGWAHYFALGLVKTAMSELEAWYRRKIRTIYLKAWKKVPTIRAELLRLNTASKETCRKVAGASMGWWAKAHFANKVITNKVIHTKWGWPALSEVVATRGWKVLGY